ncbi:MAG TPA: hypothetical protein VL309_09625 [Vicinamibacterales bacterium]|jgi:hypothetical protein|nr:hypothetical protein [Vicinamibacterales bacterium]
MTRTGRAVLALEVAAGVVPITIVGGLYAMMGLLFGAASLAASIAARSLDAAELWLGIFSLAAGGAVGLLGLWALVLATWTTGSAQPPGITLVRAALGGSAIGVLTAAATLLLMYLGPFTGRPLFVYALIAPVFVVAHRAPPLARRGER